MNKQSENKAGYTNFKDPLGLLWRMLRSGNRVAYFTLLREGVSLFLKPIGFLLIPLEKKKLAQKSTADFPLVLILGGSRSGTTLLYQTLAAYLPVSYFNNLSISFPNAPITGGKMFNRLLGKNKKDFNNFYGSVSGFNGPNDGFHIWNRWFGEDRSRVPDQLDETQIADMAQFIHSWHATFQKPLLNKNNRNSLAIDHFEAALPGKVYYIFIKRDPIYTVQSLIKSREMVQGDREAAWGLGALQPSSNKEKATNPLYYIENICQQVYGVEQDITKALGDIDPARQMTITYETFCEKPRNIIQQIAQMVFQYPVSEKNLRDLPPFKDTNVQHLPEIEFNRIKQCVASLPTA